MEISQADRSIESDWHWRTDRRLSRRPSRWGPSIHSAPNSNHITDDWPLPPS